MPNQVGGDLLHTMSVTRLSRVRTVRSSSSMIVASFIVALPHPASVRFGQLPVVLANILQLIRSILVQAGAGFLELGSILAEESSRSLGLSRDCTRSAAAVCLKGQK